MDIYDTTIKDPKEAILRAAAFEEAGDYEGMYSVICRGLNMDCRNYELYYMLGFYYLRDNIDRAFLCFQNALFFCEDDKDREEISRTVDDILSSGNVSVKDTVIVIVSYNSEYMMQKCIESIRLTTDMDHVHIVVVDNASTDGVAEWLENQNDVTLVRNTENVGFSGACNQGVLKAEEEGWGECEVFLLNNDTRLPLNALFSLRMALYSGNKVGATGAISNSAGNEQRIEIDFEMPEEYVEFGEKLNVPGEDFQEDRVRLSGFAMLIKGGLYSAVGGMDEDFSPGYFEDDDLCMRIEKAGYKLLLARNAYIYHEGTQSFSKRNDLNAIILAHYELFCRKYGFDIIVYANADQKLINQISYDRYDAFNLLHVGCGLGAELKEIRFRYPNANVVGVEGNTVLREIAQKTDVIFGSVQETVDILPASSINVLIIDPRMQGRLSDDEADMLSRVCNRNCVIIPKRPQCS